MTAVAHDDDGDHPSDEGETQIVAVLAREPGMDEQEAKAVTNVTAHAKGLRIDLGAVIDEIKMVTLNNPAGFDFTPVKSKTGDLLIAIIDSAKFGYDEPSGMFGFFAGGVARHSGVTSSFR